jgi:hypothetical protein
MSRKISLAFIVEGPLPVRTRTAILSSFAWYRTIRPLGNLEIKRSESFRRSLSLGACMTAESISLIVTVELKRSLDSIA